VTCVSPPGATVVGVRVHERGENELVRAGSGVIERAPVVQIDVCRCGHVHAAGAPHAATAPTAEPEWALASAWSWLTRPVDADDAVLDETAELDVADDVPWWDARASPERRRTMLGVVLLGELQAGVLLRAVWEVVQSSPTGPLA
jgi:hypothetical protein